MLKNRIVLPLFLLTAIVLKVNAESDTYWIKAGDRALAAQNHEESILFYSKAIENNPKHVLGYLKRAKAHKASGDFRKSAEDLQKAYQLDPVYCETYLKISNSSQFKNQ